MSASSVNLRKFKLKYADVELHFGLNALSELEGELSRYGRVIIATGRRSAKVSGALEEVTRLLTKHGVEYEVFSEITPNPWTSQADKLAYKVWSTGAEAVIAIGGGSVIDTAKVAAIIAVSGGRAHDYLYGERKGHGHLPVYAINLTHGTGTEVDRYSVLTDDETREKRGMISIYPKSSVDDPRYTLTLPRRHVIYTSLDAFYHAYEASTQRNASPLVLMLSSEAVRLVRSWLPKALTNPNDIEARYWLLYASMLAGIAIDLAGTNVVHTIEHILSGINPQLAHGCGLGIVGPRSAYYIHRASPEASALLLRHLDPSIKPVPGDAEKAEVAIREFQKSVEFEEKLSDYGFARDDLPAIARKAAGPLGITAKEVRDILERSL
ncbi:MAG: alcohol dehydrogenase [Thermoprotei archaeon]|nr:MAG: alcohol dehydrogenase [Thermoprotei archaeon]